MWSVYHIVCIGPIGLLWELLSTFCRLWYSCFQVTPSSLIFGIIAHLISCSLSTSGLVNALLCGLSCVELLSKLKIKRTKSLTH